MANDKILYNGGNTQVILTYSNNNTLEFVTNTASGSTFNPSITKTGNATQLWEFGDLSGGTSANTNSPSYVYNTNGNKNVRLTVDNPSQVSLIDLYSQNIVDTIDYRNFPNVTTFRTYNNASLIKVINPISSISYSSWQVFSCNLTGTLDMRTLTGLGSIFNVSGNTNLTNILFPNSSQTFSVCRMNVCGLTGNLNMSGLTGLGGAVEFYSNPNLTGVTFPNSSQTFSSFLAYSCNLTGNLNLSSLSGFGGFIQVYLNPNLTGITFPTSSQVISYFDISQNNLTGNINLSTLSNLGGNVILRSNPNMTGVTLPNTPQSIDNFSVFSCNITGNLNLTGLTNLNTRLLVPYNVNLTGVTLPTNNNTVATFSGQGSTLSSINFTAMTAFTSVNNCNIALQNNTMSAAQVNTILVDLNTISSPELIGYWKLDGNSTDPINGNNGTDTGIAYSGSGKLGGSAIFSGTSSSKIIISSATTLNVPSNKISVCAWVYPTSNSGYQVITSKVNVITYTEGWELSNSSGLLRATLRGATVDTSGSGSLPLNIWSFATFTYDGIYLKLYLNSNLQITVSGSATINSSQNLNIGVRGSTDSPFNGQIDNVMIFNRDLTQSEVTQIYNAGSGTTTPLYSGRTIDISGTNAAPTGSGLTAKTSLQGKGFTVTTN